MPDVPALYCPDCDCTYPAGPNEPFRCDCGRPLELDADARDTGVEPEPEPVSLSRLDARRGQWAFEELLAVSPRVTLGEGLTPLVEAPDRDAQFKLEYVSPTGSFKDRGAAAVVSRALGLGVERVLEDSSGNAGAAVATYAAHAGLDAEVYVPADVSDAKLTAIRRTGARTVRVEGERADVTAACVEAVEAGEGWYASHAWQPAFLAGTKTFAVEVAAQRDWSAPDAVVMPVGHGTLFLGAYRGFEELSAAGLIDDVPALYAVQATGYAPIVAALSEGGTDRPGDDPAAALSPAGTVDSVPEPAGETNEVADAVHIRDPVREEELVAAVRTTGGDAVAVGEASVERHLDELHRAGFYVEPTCAAGPAGLDRLRSRGAIGPGDDVVVPLTGTGLKTT
ncbi:threonine synthase [Halobacteriales archaeon SW_7_71_33]|nr:MAG: threonine synthase [Halobacteriales archaeon SW_7_71_33]